MHRASRPLRCTSEVYDFLQRYLKFSYGEQSGGSEIRQRYWNHLVYFGNHVCGPQVIVEGKIGYGSREERFVDCSKIIKNEINQWAKNEDGFLNRKIAILVAAPRWIDDLSPYMSQEGIPVCRIGDGETQSFWIMQITCDRTSGQLLLQFVAIWKAIWKPCRTASQHQGLWFDY